MRLDLSSVTIVNENMSVIFTTAIKISKREIRQRF